MKTITLTFFISILLLNVSAQMRVKKPNFSSFNTDKKISSEILNQLSSAEARRHPEFGTLPFNAQCSDCAEMIDKRTIDSRLFIDPKNSGHTYSQKSYFPLHYKKSENDIWRTIDFRLRPDANHPGVFSANDQPCPTKIDLNKHSTSITDRGFEFEYNKNLSLYFYDADNAYTQSTPANYTTTHVGQEGMEVENIWAGINMEATFRGGEIKTNFVLNAPLQLPISKGWMVIEDHFSLPAGYSFIESKTGEHDGSFFGGDYVVVDEQGRTRITYERPAFVDAMAWGVKGNYQLEKLGNTYTLKLFVPVSWLNRTDNTYPLFIDPTVFGQSKKGDFTATAGGITESMGFTTKPGSCNYHMQVYMPGKCQVTKAYADLEYRLQFDPTCGNPHLPSPFCTFSQVTQEIICDACGTTSGNLVCSPSSPPYTGTCSTDSNLTPGSHSILLNAIDSNFVACFSPQCDQSIDFTLVNRDSTCLDSCGWICAMGYMWQMTIEAESITETPVITLSNDTIKCSEAPSYQWYQDGFTIPGATNQFYVVNQDGSYHVEVSDSFGCLHIPSAPIVVGCHSNFTIYVDSFLTATGQYYGYNYSFGNNLTYLWDFGDSTTSTQQFPTHTYAIPGQYNVCLTVSNGIGCVDTHCDSSYLVVRTTGGLMSQLTILNPLSIHDVTDNSPISIYPNPATNLLFINTQGTAIKSVSLYTVDGKLLKEIKQLTDNGIDISGFSKGVYLAEIKTKDFSAKRRWTKM